MEIKTKDTFNLIFQIVSALILIIVGFYQIYSIDKEQTIQALILFGIIVAVGILGFIISYSIGKYKDIRQELRSNREKMEEIEKKLRYEKVLNEFDKRISILETMKKGKKGQQIDPRWIILIILLILLYLYLNSIGVI